MALTSSATENRKLSEGDGLIGKLAVLDISESGEQIGEKLLVLLDAKQRQELAQYILSRETDHHFDIPVHDTHPLISPIVQAAHLTEVQAENLYFCLENRTVYISETEIFLTVKEFDIFSMLILNPSRVLTYDMIMDCVWHETLDFYSRRAINNHVSNLRKKLRVTPESPDYIKSIRDIGYKFNPDIEVY